MDAPDPEDVLASIAADYADRLAHLNPGGAQKTSGSYYTPATLVGCLLDTTLQPLIDERCTATTPAARIGRLLDLTVCDPSCGSGVFLTAAARRIADAVAREYAAMDSRETRTPLGQPAVSDEQRHRALRAVTARCVHGVDLSEMAAELCKVSLWLQAADPDLPHTYLDSRIRVGNSLLGTTPALMAQGIPDAAYTALDCDNPKVVAELRRRNATERNHKLSDHLQEGLF